VPPRRPAAPQDPDARADGAAAPDGVAAGALSALLGELAESPDAALGSTWEAALRPGAAFGRFELVREVGRGGFGVVWEARDRELGRAVAFKAVRAGPHARLREERLLREAEAAARLSHPNIVTLHDVGRTEHGPYLVLELLRGRPLGARLAEGAVPLAEALRLATEIARGLAHAHGQGVVHRDLTPGNVFLCDDGQVKLLDFGLAHAFGQRRQSGGTPAFMAPEQWRGAPEDERTDVFALGVILHRLLSGALPFPEDDRGKAVTSSRPAPALEVPELPGLGPLVARMLAKDPVDRPRDGAEALAALDALRRTHERSSELGTTPPARALPSRRRALLPALAAAAAAVLAAGGAALWSWRGPDRAGPDGAAAERVAVAVADFANQTGEVDLDGLSGMLITSLEQSRRLSVLTRVRMLDLLRQLGKEDVRAVDEALGREVARAAGVRALVLATIRRFDALYTIELKALDPATSEYLFTLKEEGQGKGSVPGMIDRLSERTRERLRESPAEVSASRVKVADATTASFVAYGHYFRGEQLQEATRYDEAIEAYRRAVAADPSFALARYQIAYLGEFVGLAAEERRAQMAEALRFADRVPEKERLLIRAWNAHMEGRGEESHRLYAEAVKAYPQDKHALYLAGDLAFHEGDSARALPFFERALALDPTWEPALMHLTDCLAALGRERELAEAARAWVERAPTASAWRAATQAQVLAGRTEAALASARKAFELDRSVYSRGLLAEVLFRAGLFAEADALLDEAAAVPGASPHDAKRLASLRISGLVYRGRRAEALALSDALPGDGKGPLPGTELRRVLGLLTDLRPEQGPEAARELQKLPRPASHAAALAALGGDLAYAEELARPLAEGSAGRLAWEATVAWRRGDPGRAVELYARAIAAPDPDGRTVSAWMRALAALEAKRPADALESLALFRTRAGGIGRAAAFPRSLHLEALALEQQGDHAGARERLDHLLRLWERADPGQPLLDDARALRGRLGEARRR
jgi:tetratricopeptide (TPR) repeat protein